MKNYKQILEAINRGILLALDDFEDEELVLHVKSKQVLNRDYTKEYLDLMEEVVDLGLPSGTLWCKTNLGANCGNTPESWYGKYYAWGEIKTKSEFSWSTYKYAEHYTDLSETECLTKYCNNPQKGYNQITNTWGFTDNLTLLLPEDDAACQNKHIHNFKFRIPNKELCEELIKYTINYWVNNYDPNKIEHNPKDDGGIQGLNGMIFKGKNGNLVFIPAAGYRYSFNIGNTGSSCYLWSSSLYLNNPCGAYYLYSDSADIFIRSNLRYDGYNIRPVINL